MGYGTITGINENYPNILSNNNTTTNPQISSESTVLNMGTVNNSNVDTLELTQDKATETDAETSNETAVKDDPTGLRAEFEQIKKEQGIVGKAWNGIKNALPFLGHIGCKGSDEIETIIKQAEDGEITVDEAKEKLEKYRKNQSKGTDAALNLATFGIVSAVCLLAGPLGWSALAALGIATATGIVSRVALGATEAATNEIKGDYTMQNVKEDADKGAIIGLCRGLGKFFSIRINRRAAMMGANAIKNSDKASLASKTAYNVISKNFSKVV